MTNETKPAIFNVTTKPTKDDLNLFIQKLWPKAPNIEKARALSICLRYSLDPMRGHVVLLPFKDRKTNETSWAMALGISASRMLASRVMRYSYLDNTPRLMTEDEQTLIFGEVATDRIWAITKLRGTDGTEAAGYGYWIKAELPYGRGNSIYNMAMIRSERAALDRLVPDVLPQVEDTVDETSPVIENGPELVAEAPYVEVIGDDEQPTLWE